MVALTTPNSGTYLTLLMLGSFAIFVLGLALRFGRWEKEGGEGLSGVILVGMVGAGMFVASFAGGILNIFVTFLWAPACLGLLVVFWKTSLDPAGPANSVRLSLPAIMVGMGLAGALFLRQTEVITGFEVNFRNDPELLIRGFEMAGSGMIEFISRLIVDLSVAGMTAYLVLKGKGTAYGVNVKRQAAIIAAVAIIPLVGWVSASIAISGAAEAVKGRALDIATAENFGSLTGCRSEIYQRSLSTAV